MSTEPLTFDEALQAARSVVAEQGANFIYNERIDGSCAYVPSTDPRFPFSSEEVMPASGAAITGCLVGRIIERTGRMTDRIASSGDTVSSLIKYGLLAVDGERTQEFLSALQTKQDLGETWGGALFHAKEKFRND